MRFKTNSIRYNVYTIFPPVLKILCFKICYRRKVSKKLRHSCGIDAAKLRQSCSKVAAKMRHSCGKVAAKLQCIIATQLCSNYAATILCPPRAMLHSNVAATIHRHCAATMQHRNQVQGCCKHSATLPQRSEQYGRSVRVERRQEVGAHTRGYLFRSGILPEGLAADG